PHPFLPQLFDLLQKGPVDQTQEELHLFPGPVPVFRTESVDGEDGNTPLGGVAHRPFESLDPLLMAESAGQGPASGPAPIAVHDYAHMLWQTLGPSAQVHAS